MEKQIKTDRLTDRQIYIMDRYISDRQTENRWTDRAQHLSVG